MNILRQLRDGMPWLRNESGSALLELSLILPLMILMLAGVFDLGLGIQQSLLVSEAARAGTAFGQIPGNDTNLTGMQQAATAAAGSLQSFTATASEWCSCSPNGAVISCNSSCPAGNPVTYVQVKTSAVLPSVFNYSGLPTILDLSGFSAVRVR
jgi:Flp pilus assembly protein TadG